MNGDMNHVLVQPDMADFTPAVTLTPLNRTSALNTGIKASKRPGQLSLKLGTHQQLLQKLRGVLWETGLTDYSPWN